MQSLVFAFDFCNLASFGVLRASVFSAVLEKFCSPHIFLESYELVLCPVTRVRKIFLLTESWILF